MNILPVTVWPAVTDVIVHGPKQLLPTHSGILACVAGPAYWHDTPRVPVRGMAETVYALDVPPVAGIVTFAAAIWKDCASALDG